jgi:hypothetical protein
MTRGYILLSHLRLPQPGGPGLHIYIPEEQGGPAIPPGTGFPFLSPLTTRRDYGGSILTRLRAGERRSTFFYIIYINSVRTSKETQYISVLQLGTLDRLYGLVVSVLGYRPGGPGSIPGTTRKEKYNVSERGPLSLVSTTEELLDRKVAAPV